ncbi:MAG: response regulator [Planctomycetes bacterium]|nr:response regulator [Planctomycetota bacterium]
MAGAILPLVLVADEDTSLLQGIEPPCRHWGFRVVGVANMVQLEKQLAREAPDFLLQNCHFDGLHGLAFLQEVLQRHPALAVILLTDPGSIQSAVAGLQLGAFDYLTRPPDLHRLRIILSHGVEKRRLHQRLQFLEQLLGSSATPGPTDKGLRPIEQLEKEAILEGLHHTQGNVREVARLLGLGQATVYRKIKRYRIVRSRAPRERRHLKETAEAS